MHDQAFFVFRLSLLIFFDEEGDKMENKQFYLTIKGEQVEVTEEVYREYIRFMRVERSRRLRAWKCKIAKL